MVYRGKSVVGSAYDDVADIVPGKENSCIKVRIVRLWKVPAFLDPTEWGSIEMVLIDGKGAKIHGSVRKQLIPDFESKLEEGNVYELTAFSIFPNSGNYRSTLHPYKVIFQPNTEVTPIEGSNIDQYGIRVTSLAEVSAFSHEYEFLVDVIGVVTGISAEREYIRDGKITKMVTVQLTDDSGKCDCALFGEYADQLNNRMGKSVVGQPIVVIQFAKIKMFRGRASLQNVLSTTRLMVNPDIPEVEKFRNSIAVHGIEIDTAVPIIGQPARPSLEEEFLRLHPKKTIAELNELRDDGTVVVCADIMRVVGGKDWWYTACRCHKSVTAVGGAYFCKGCARHVFQVVPRFRVKIEVGDGAATSVFVLFDSDMSYIMEKSCAYFVAQSMSNNADSYPVEFDSIVGKRLLFAVDKVFSKASASDGSYRVRRICADSKIIEQFCAHGYCVAAKSVGSHANELESDGNSEDGGHDSEEKSLEFVNDIIVMPTAAGEGDDCDSDAPFVAKRSVHRVFEGPDKPKRSGRPKKIKVEKEE